MKYINFDYKKFKADSDEFFSLKELAVETGVSYAIIRNIVTGRRKLTMDELVELCKPMNLNPTDYLIVKSPVVITLLTNKGGAGKTTVAVNLASALVNAFNKKVLVIDTDLQQNTTMHLGWLFPEEQKFPITEKQNIYEAFTKDEDISKHILHTEWDGIDLVPASDAMAKIDEEMARITLGEFRLKSILSKVVNENVNGYDFVIIDCNPILSKFNESALFASDYLIVPLEASSFGLRGIQYVLDFYQNVKKHNKKLELLGIVLNKYDKQKIITKRVMEVINNDELLKSSVFETKIPVDTTIEQSQAYNEPLFVTFPQSRAYKAYVSLAKEVLDRTDK